MSKIQAAPPHAAPTTTKPSPNWGLWATCAGLAVAFLPLLSLQANNLWARPHYQFAPLAIIGSMALAWREWHLPERLYFDEQRKGRLVGYAIVAAGWVLLALGTLAHSGWIGEFAALVTLGGVIVALSGGQGFRRLLPAWILLWITLPPPGLIDRHLIISLQGLTTRGASRILDLLSVFHYFAGTTIEVAGRRFVVEDACSGIHSLNAAGAAVLFFALWLRRGPLAAGFLLLATTGWVLAANIVRVATVVLAGVWLNMDLSNGWRHEMLGFLLFGVVLALAFSTDRIRDAFAATLLSRQRSSRKDANRRESGGPVLENKASLVTATNRSGSRAAWWIAAAFALLGGVQLVLFLRTPPGKEGTLRPEKFAALNVETLPARWRSWTRDDFRTEHYNKLLSPDKKSRVWHYQADGFTATMALDHPFEGWHELPDCYRFQGWRSERRGVVSAGQAGDFVDVVLERSLDEHGYLAFGLFDDQWRPLPPPASNAEATLQARWSDMRLRPVKSTYQMQLFVESALPLTTNEQVQARAFFQEASVILGRSLGAD